MKTKVKFTQSAERHMASICGHASLAELSLGVWVQTGDVIELVGEPESVNLIVNSRRILLHSNGEQELEFVLDYPVRHAAR